MARLPVPRPLPIVPTPATTAAPTVSVSVRPEHLTVASVPGYSYLGCYADFGTRVLRGTSSTGITDGGLNPVSCCSWCSEQNRDYTLCAVEHASECYCDSTVPQASTAANRCTSACKGNDKAHCGGYWAMDLYSSKLVPTAQDVPGYANLGCFTDFSDDRRILKGTELSFFELSPQTCCNWCASVDSDFRYCGVEFGGQCRCDRTTGTTVAAHASECSMPCFGLPNYKCGGTWRINMYEATTDRKATAGDIKASTTTTTTTTTTGAPATATATEDSDEEEPKDMSRKEIIALAVGIPSVLAAIVTIAECIRKRRKGQDE